MSRRDGSIGLGCTAQECRTGKACTGPRTAVAAAALHEHPDPMTTDTRIFLGPEFPLPLNLPFTTSQAHQAGISRRQLAHLVRERLVRRILLGVYVAAQEPDSQLLRARALLLVVPAGYVVTDESAGWLAGASMILRPGAHTNPPELTIFGADGRARLRNELAESGRRTLATHDIHEVHGVLATTPLRTALDLGRLRHRDRALSAMDQLLRLGTFSRGQLVDGSTRFKGFRGVRQLRALAPLADGRSESPGESALRLRFLDAGLPAPVPQLEIFDRDGFVARADLAIEKLKFIAEYDGERWHGEDRRDHDRNRRERLEDAGWTVRVLTAANVYGRKQDAIEILTDGVRESRRRFGLVNGDTQAI